MIFRERKGGGYRYAGEELFVKLYAAFKYGFVQGVYEKRVYKG